MHNLISVGKLDCVFFDVMYSTRFDPRMFLRVHNHRLNIDKKVCSKLSGHILLFPFF